MLVARHPDALAERNEAVVIARQNRLIAPIGLKPGRKILGEIKHEILLDQSIDSRAAVDAAMAGIDHDDRLAAGGLNLRRNPRLARLRESRARGLRGRRKMIAVGLGQLDDEARLRAVHARLAARPHDAGRAGEIDNDARAALFELAEAE